MTQTATQIIVAHINDGRAQDDTAPYTPIDADDLDRDLVDEIRSEAACAGDDLLAAACDAWVQRRGDEPVQQYVIESTHGEYLTSHGEWGVRQAAEAYYRHQIPAVIPWPTEADPEGMAYIADRGQCYHDDEHVYGVAAPIRAW